MSVLILFILFILIYLPNKPWMIIVFNEKLSHLPSSARTDPYFLHQALRMMEIRQIIFLCSRTPPHIDKRPKEKNIYL